MEPLSTMSFFSGCGGLDLGFRGGFEFMGERFERLPFVTVKAYDFDAKCVQTYNRNLGEHAEVLDLSEVEKLDLEACRVLIGGFPCQDFSSCGPLRGVTSERGRLYLAMAHYMKRYRPMIAVAENVLHLHRIDGGKALETIVTDFERSGYRTVKWILRAEDYGVPQRRARIFLISIRDDLDGEPTPPPMTHLYTPRSIEWAIHDLETVVDESVPNQSQFFLASTAKRGNGQGDEISRAQLPAYTVRANAKSRVQFHYKLPRRLTVRECARLQTFPDWFVFPHSKTTNTMQIGNAVPPVFAHAVAKSIANFLSTVHAD